MATGKTYFPRPSYRFLACKSDYSARVTAESAFELDESDIYNSGMVNSPEFRKSVVSGSRVSRKSHASSTTSSSNRVSAPGGTAASLPVNIPDWSKILRDEYRENRRKDSIDDGDDIVHGCNSLNGGGTVPPHEFLARQRMASFSVHEGVGRTLKGRDLSRIRNAIWAKTGFQD